MQVGYGIPFFAGYRWMLGKKGWYLSGELDFTLHGGTVDGQLTSVRESTDRNQDGERSHDSWAYDKDWSYGLTFKLGGSPSFLTAPGLLTELIGEGVSVYGLGGVRGLRTRMRVNYTDCPLSGECSPENSRSGEFGFSEHLFGWTAGGGIEKMCKVFGQTFGLRKEVRYTHYERHKWSTNHGGRSRGPAKMDEDEWDIIVMLAWYF